MDTHSGVTKALKRMNRQLNLPQLQKIMMEFERESEIMDLKEETISDTIDDAIGEDDEDEVRRKGERGRGRERERERE
jgi:charged multivesicular body protein 2A